MIAAPLTATLQRRNNKFRLFVKQNAGLTVGTAILLAFTAAAALSSLISPYGPNQLDTNAVYQGPSLAHLLGTDNFGRDILSRMIWGTRIDFLVALLVTLFSVTLGVAIGAFVGYVRGWLDVVVMRFVDSLQAFPALIIALAIVGIVSHSVTSQTVDIAVVIAVIVFVQAPTYIRLVRARVLVLRVAEYTDAARVLGVARGRIIIRHMLPNAMGSVYPAAAQNAGYAILLTAGLAFVGVGIVPPTAEWGSMIYVGAQYLRNGDWWMSVFPGLAIAFSLFGLTLVSDGLQTLQGRR